LGGDPVTKRHEIWQLIDGIQMDLRTASTKLVELRGRLAALDLPRTRIGWEARTCAACQAVFRSIWELQEHAYRVHDGPLPDSYAKADQRAGDAG
jgi:hypothetical protein